MEVLVALLIFGLLMVGLTQGLKLGRRSWDKQSQFVSIRDQLDSTDRALRYLVSQIDPSGEGDNEPFVGGTDHVEFRTYLPRAVALPTRRINARLFLDDKHRLMLRWRMALHEQRVAPVPSTDTELLSGVEKLELSYWHSSADNGPAGWSKEWAADGVPSLVKIHLVFPKGDPRQWPDIIAAPSIDQAAG